MTTSGFSRFNLDVADIMEEAYERAGRMSQSGYDAITARRSLNLVFQEFINLGVNLWTVEESTLDFVAGQPIYTLDPDTSDVLPDAINRRNGLDQEVRRIMRDEYLSYPNKTQPGRAIQFLITRNQDAPLITFWPVPENSTDQFIYYRIRYLQDVDDSSQTPDMPRRFLPAVISGLAWHLANKSPAINDINRRQELRACYDNDLLKAMEEDTDRASTYILPDLERR